MPEQEEWNRLASEFRLAFKSAEQKAHAVIFEVNLQYGRPKLKLFRERIKNRNGLRVAYVSQTWQNFFFLFFFFF